MLHLRVIQPSADALPNEEPSNVSRLYNPSRFDFRWNADYTAFEPLRCAWWDDASYARYQSEDRDYEEEEYYAQKDAEHDRDMREAEAEGIAESLGQGKHCTYRVALDFGGFCTGDYQARACETCDDPIPF